MSDSPQRGICQRSGFDYPMHELVREWTGLLVHRRFVDTRNPQDFVTGVRESPPPRVSSPEPPDAFLATQITSKDYGMLLSADGAPLMTKGG
jgi:hypothetical protein